jgi:hypothetical protein
MEDLKNLKCDSCGSKFSEVGFDYYEGGVKDYDLILKKSGKNNFYLKYVDCGNFWVNDNGFRCGDCGEETGFDEDEIISILKVDNNKKHDKKR